MANLPFNEDYHKNPYPQKHPDKWQITPPTKPKPATIFDVFPRLDRLAIGYESFFDTLNSLASTPTSSFPPYNITKFKDGKWEIEMALAGFRKKDVDITVKDRTIIVSSNVKDESTSGEVIHHGIAQRNFTSTFVMAEYVEVDSAKMEDGILTIKLVTNLPDDKKPKTIDIK